MIEDLNSGVQPLSKEEKRRHFEEVMHTMFDELDSGVYWVTDLTDKQKRELELRFGERGYLNWPFVGREFHSWRTERVHAGQEGLERPEAPHPLLGEIGRMMGENGILWDHNWVPGLHEEDRKNFHDIFERSLVKALAVRSRRNLFELEGLEQNDPDLARKIWGYRLIGTLNTRLHVDRTSGSTRIFPPIKK